MKRKGIILFVSALLLAVASCNDVEPINPEPEPFPGPLIEYACPNEGDIYKVFPDTMVVNKNGLYVKVDDKYHKVPYKDPHGMSFGLFTCEGKIDELADAANSPLSWEIARSENKVRDTVYATSGSILINQLLLPKDVQQISKFEDGQMMEYEVALLNFNQDTIQTSNTVVQYLKDVQE